MVSNKNYTSIILQTDAATSMHEEEEEITKESTQKKISGELSTESIIFATIIKH